MRPLILSIAALLFLNLSACTQANSLETAVNGDWRTASFAARDQYRHPKATLEFFQVKPEHSVMEIWPSGGWYAEILAPYLRNSGEYIGAGFSLSAKRTPQWRKNMQQKLNQRFAAQPDIYDQVIWTALAVPEDTSIAPAGSADRALTFRNVHNWMKGQYAPAVFTAMFKALKPGGLLGVVEHRAKPGTSWDEMITSGYVTEATVKKLAERAGFVFVASSEINANPKDSKDHPKGVWTLPPSLRLKDQDKAKYLAIGESDRMTLLFKKPEL